MTAFSACLFVLAAIVSLTTLAVGGRQLLLAARSLRAQLAACPHSTAIHCHATQRVPLATAAAAGPILIAVRRAERRTAAGSTGRKVPARALAA